MKKIVVVVVLIVCLSFASTRFTGFGLRSTKRMFNLSDEWMHDASEVNQEEVFGKKTAFIYKTEDDDERIMVISTNLLNILWRYEMMSTFHPSNYEINSLDKIPYVALNPYLQLVDDHSYFYERTDPTVFFVKSLNDTLNYIICAKSDIDFENINISETDGLKILTQQYSDLSFSLFNEGYALFDAPSLDNIYNYSLYAFNHEGELVHEIAIVELAK